MESDCDRIGAHFRYLHGNSGSRASEHRLELYRLLVSELKMGALMCVVRVRVR